MKESREMSSLASGTALAAELLLAASRVEGGAVALEVHPDAERKLAHRHHGRPVPTPNPALLNRARHTGRGLARPAALALALALAFAMRLGQGAPASRAPLRGELAALARAAHEASRAQVSEQSRSARLFKQMA